MSLAAVITCAQNSAWRSKREAHRWRKWTRCGRMRGASDRAFLNHLNLALLPDRREEQRDRNQKSG